MVQTRVGVNVPGRSSFDKSFKNILTTKVGTITPIVSRLMIPGSKAHMRIAISASLPPLASDTFMRCDLKCEAFFVPLRLLYGGFEDFFTMNKVRNFATGTDVVPEMPCIIVDHNAWSTEKTFLGPGSLADYLGARIDTSATPSSDAALNVTKFLAYHKVYDDWYRNAKIQKPVFVRPMNLDLSSQQYVRCAPYLAFEYTHGWGLSDTFGDGVSLGSLRQRNWNDDYFTIATLSPQVGNAQSVSTSGNTFTIAALRAANSLQQFQERSNLAAPRMQDYVKAHYGADLMSGVAQRCVLLGSASFPVYSKGIEANGASAATNNPFATVGARYGNAFASGSDFVCDFEANEPGYLWVNATLVPEANYSLGIDKEMRLFISNGSQVDIPDPLLENVGNEPIYSTELDGQLATSLGLVFGYVPRYTRHKTGLNEVHGLLRAGQSLDSFVAQRSGWLSTLSSSFLQIPTTALDNVTAVTSDLSTYGCWIDSAIDLKVSEPLTECAMPSLQDPAYEHGKRVYFNINGSKL